MSREDRIVSKLEGAYDFIEYVNDNFPHVLIEWKNRVGAGVNAPVTASETKDRLQGVSDHATEDR
jgi:hypothetical protein